MDIATLIHNASITAAAAIEANLLEQLAECAELRATDTGKLPTMKGVKEAAELSGLPAGLIRQLAKSGEIKAAWSGRTAYINMESLGEYLSRTPEKRTPEPEQPKTPDIIHTKRQKPLVSPLEAVPKKPGLGAIANDRGMRVIE